MLTRRILEMSLVATLAAYLTAMVFVFSSSEQSCPETNKQCPPDRAQETRNGQQGESLRHWMTHDAAGFFTLWLVVVGGAQLVLFWVQLKYIRQSLNDAKIAANAAKLSADAAKRSADALPAIERAYVYLDDGISDNIDEIVNSDAERIDAIIKFSFKNHGRTPAILKSIKCGAGRTTSYHPISRGKIQMFGGEFPNIVIGSGNNSMIFERLCALTRSGYMKVKGGYGYIIFFGEFRYSDVLGDTWRVGFHREYDFIRKRFTFSPYFDQLDYYEKEDS
jgi:hypothetical protein